MARPKHPSKEIETALAYAEQHGWSVEKSSGHAHAWGKMKCPQNNAACWAGRNCIKSIWSTPRNERNHANDLRRIVDKCQFLNEEDDD